MPLVRLVTGSESFKGGTSGLLAHVVATSAGKCQDARPLFVSDAAKQSKYGITQPARSVYLPAANNGVAESGNWFDGNFVLPEGTILRLFGRRHERVGGRNGHLLPLRRAVVFIRIREGAATRRLQLTKIEDASSSNVAVAIEGQYDILSLREAASYGVMLTNEDLTLSKVDAVREVFVHTTLSGQRVTRQKTKTETIRTADNPEGVQVSMKRSPRAINLGD